MPAPATAHDHPARLLGCAGEPADVHLQESIRADELQVLASAEAIVVAELALLTASAAPTYFSWSHSGIGSVGWPYDSCSPNLLALFTYFARTYPGMQNYGCHNQRVISGSGTLSSHAWGAAYDMLFPNRVIAMQAADFMVRNYLALGINTIHNYVNQTMWKPGLGWVSASIGSPGGQWLHIETTPAMFLDDRSVEEKVTGFGPPIPPALPPYDPWKGQWGLFRVAAKPRLDRYAGLFEDPNAPGAKAPFSMYFNHALIFRAGRIIAEPFTVFTDSSIAAEREVGQFLQSMAVGRGQPRNMGLDIEMFAGFCGEQMWTIVDQLTA